MTVFLKRLGIAVGAILGLFLVLGGVFYVMGKAKVLEVQKVSPPLTLVGSDSVSLARGEHLSEILSCRVCHGESYEGKIFLDIPPFRAVASNLTSGEGGVGSDYTDADWDRALRYGVKPNGQSMLVMPSNLFHPLSDEDAADVIAYIKNLPAVNNILPETEFRMPLFLMAGMPGQDLFYNVFDETDARKPVPTAAASAEYGAYLATLSCVQCHGKDLRGGAHPEPGAPDGTDLAAAGQWQLDAFAIAMREGKTPYGTVLQTEYMPWSQSYQYLNDLEIEALYLYLGTLLD